MQDASLKDIYCATNANNYYAQDGYPIGEAGNYNYTMVVNFDQSDYFISGE